MGLAAWRKRFWQRLCSAGGGFAAQRLSWTQVVPCPSSWAACREQIQCRSACAGPAPPSRVLLSLSSRPLGHPVPSISVIMAQRGGGGYYPRVLSLPRCDLAGRGVQGLAPTWKPFHCQEPDFWGVVLVKAGQGWMGRGENPMLGPAGMGQTLLNPHPLLTDSLRWWSAL